MTEQKAFKIIKPGAYDLPMDLYHGDCCDGPSLSSSGVKALLGSPALYWRSSPLNPDRQEDESTKAFDLGRAAHLMLLEPEAAKEGIVVIPEAALSSNGSVSTKEAKEIINAARAAGAVPLKPAEWQQIEAMGEAMARHPYAMRAIKHGRAEQSLFWKHKSDIWLKCRPDFLPHKSGQYIVDLKTCADLGRWERDALTTLRYDVSAAMYLRGVHEVLGLRPKGFLFLVQEKSPPFRIAMLALTIDDEDSNRILRNAELDLERAIETFQTCWSEGRWPDPYETPREIQPPGWLTGIIEGRLERETTNDRFTIAE